MTEEYPRPALHAILGSSFQALIYLLLFYHFFNKFPSGIRHLCTTMPWTIWQAFVVLWGVCWMFIQNRAGPWGETLPPSQPQQERDFNADGIPFYFQPPAAHNGIVDITALLELSESFPLDYGSSALTTSDPTFGDFEFPPRPVYSGATESHQQGFMLPEVPVTHEGIFSVSRPLAPATASSRTVGIQNPPQLVQAILQRAPKGAPSTACTLYVFLHVGTLPCVWVNIYSSGPPNRLPLHAPTVERNLTERISSVGTSVSRSTGSSQVRTRPTSLAQILTAKGRSKAMGSCEKTSCRTTLTTTDAKLREDHPRYNGVSLLMALLPCCSIPAPGRPLGIPEGKMYRHRMRLRLRLPSSKATTTRLSRHQTRGAAPSPYWRPQSRHGRSRPHSCIKKPRFLSNKRHLVWERPAAGSLPLSRGLNLPKML